MQEQKAHISREMEIFRKNQKEMLEIKKRHCNRNGEKQILYINAYMRNIEKRYK